MVVGCIYCSSNSSRGRSIRGFRSGCIIVLVESWSSCSSRKIGHRLVFFYARGDGPSLCCCESSSKLTQQIYDSLQTGNVSAHHRRHLFVFVASITSIQLMFVRRNNCADGSCDGSRGPVPKFRQSRDIQIWMSYDLQFRTCLGIPRRGKKGY